MPNPESTAITATIVYTANTGEKLVNETYGPNNIRRIETGTLDPRPVRINDGRPLAGELSLDRNGFMLVAHPTAVKDFFDKQELASVYYPEVEQLIKHHAGASRVVVFDHTLRSGDESEREAKLVREPILSAHNDYTEWSGPQRVRDLLPAEAERLLAGRFAIIQVWRAINQPIQTNPLAMADAQSVPFDDFMIVERRFPDRVGQTYRLRYNAAHRWFYFPQMRRDEALVFKVFDSATDGRARFTAHTAFTAPNTPPGTPASSEQGSRLRDASVRESGAGPSNAGVGSASGVTSPEWAPVPPSDGLPPRQSIEARALAFFAG